MPLKSYFSPTSMPTPVTNYQFSTYECNACGNKVAAGQIYFCSPCWWKLPTNLRVHMMQIHLHNPKGVGSKIHQCVRVLKPA